MMATEGKCRPKWKAKQVSQADNMGLWRQEGERSKRHKSAVTIWEMSLDCMKQHRGIVNTALSTIWGPRWIIYLQSSLSSVESCGEHRWPSHRILPWKDYQLHTSTFTTVLFIYQTHSQQSVLLVKACSWTPCVYCERLYLERVSSGFCREGRLHLPWRREAGAPGVCSWQQRVLRMNAMKLISKPECILAKQR